MRVRDLFEGCHIELMPLPTNQWVVGVARKIEAGATQVVPNLSLALDLVEHLAEMMVDETEVTGTAAQIEEARERVEELLLRSAADEPWDPTAHLDPRWDDLREWFERQMERGEG